MEYRIYLRALDPDDYKTTAAWRYDDEMWDMVVGPKYFVSESYERKWAETAAFNPNEIRCMICLKENGKPIGLVSLVGLDMIYRKADIGIMIGEKDSRHKGFGQEAVGLLCGFAFNERGLNRIQAQVLEDNTASLKMFASVGFITEGTMRKAVFKNGQWKNLKILGLLKEDFGQL